MLETYNLNIQFDLLVCQVVENCRIFIYDRNKFNTVTTSFPDTGFHYGPQPGYSLFFLVTTVAVKFQNVEQSIMLRF